MATNFVQDGHIVTITAPAGGVSSGDGILVGALFGVALTDAAEGEAVNVQLSGAWSLPKASAAVFAQGGAVSWDSTAGQCVAPATGKVPVGTALVAAGSGTTSVVVRLDGTATAAA
ncbi:DUF2190 family protein [Pararhodospirillum oryzae]|uniref:DUF2190 family protein n=1 Tax=Pararhodospirillum oryzae TaxID=478448 RepID=A0A512H669_9PROT|nr:DUF2190 family protein [Pararhodospirillum oryzae]GEO80965.1 hypothetical protein ROR02_10960 [Pararhodospirillum oryzae]